MDNNTQIIRGDELILMDSINSQIAQNLNQIGMNSILHFIPCLRTICFFPTLLHN